MVFAILAIVNAIATFFPKTIEFFFLPYLFYSCIFLSFLSLFLPKTISYVVNNGIFQLELYFLSYVIFFWKYFFIKRKNQYTNFPNEKYKSLSPNYPILRYTKGFKGKKLVDVDLEKNEKPNVIFLFMESFRANNIGCLNGSIPASPNFDKLSKEGILFSNFYSNGVLTDKAIIASLFGILPIFRSSFLSYYENYPIIGLPQLMKGHGYNNIYMHNGHLSFDRQLLFFQNHGFDAIIGHNTIKQTFPKAKETSWGIHDEYLMKYAAEKLSKETNPSFLCLFTISNHHPWEKPPRLDNNLPKSISPTYQNYLQTFSYSDYSLGLFIDLLKEKNLLKNSIIFIFADHGQPMGEHNDNYSSQKFLYEENIHVPLLILFDGKINKPKTIDKLSTQVDLLPTVMDILQLDGFHHSFGSSLIREEAKKTIYFNNPYEKTYFGIRQEEYKYIFSPNTHNEELFDIKKDPKEKNSITNDKLSASLKKNLEEMITFLFQLYKKKRFVPKELLSIKKALVIEKNEDEKSIFKKINKYPTTTYIDLSNCIKINDEILEKVFTTLPELTYVNISNCPLITDKSLLTLSKRCKKLLFLDVSGCLLLTDEGISEFLSNAQFLESFYAKDILDLKNPIIRKNKTKLINLNILGCKNLSDTGILQIAKGSPHLQQLHLDCSSLSNEGFNKISKYLKKLENLMAYNGEQISDTSLISLFKQNPLLSFVFLESFPMITDKALSYLKSKFIKVLGFCFCENITDMGIKNLISPSYRTAVKFL